MNTQKISVIIPVYNTSEFLEDSVRSVMNQSYRNLEIICVNDGSTDNSLDILKKLRDEDDRIIIVDKPNGGLGDARNHGMKHATAEWITFLDSDDSLEPETYKTVSEQAFPLNPDMVHFGVRMIYRDNVGNRKKDENYYSIRYEGLVEADNNMKATDDCAVWNKLFRKSILDRYDIHFEKILYEDYPFTMQYRSVADKIFYIKDKFHRYLRRDGSIMAKTFEGTPRSIDHMYALGYVADFWKRNNLLKKNADIAGRMFSYCYTFALKHASESIIPSIAEYALKLHNEYSVFSEKIDVTRRHGTILFTDRDFKHKTSTRVLESIFTIKKEYYNYQLYKVLRIFSLTIFKTRCKQQP